MTDPCYQHDIIILDRSGSIRSILRGMQDGFREFVSSQAALVPSADSELTRVTASLWQFDEHVDCVASFVPVTDLAAHEIVPRGMTALHEAVGRAVTAEGEKLAALPEDERPGQVVVVIASDGVQNFPLKWTGPQVRELLERQQRDYRWQVIYMGTNQDAFAEAGAVGVASPSVLDYASDDRSTRSAWRSSAAAVGRYSSIGGQSLGVSYTDEERSAAKEGE